jgi:hypothetical protein
MADEENNINRKQENQEDIVAPEDQPDFTQPEENLRQAAENLREEAKIVDENKPDDSIQPRKTEYRPAEDHKNHGDPEKVAKRIGNTTTGILGRRPIVIVLIVGAIVLSGFLLYSQIQLSNQAYKIENFNALWNQSLADLRSGNTSIEEYCNNRVHDEDICNRFKSLQYMN